MAPIFKTSLALLSVSAALLSSIDGVSAKKHNHNYGRHMKMAKRGSLFEDLSKRADELAPFGYDRCELKRALASARTVPPFSSDGGEHNEQQEYSTQLDTVYSTCYPCSLSLPSASLKSSLPSSLETRTDPHVLCLAQSSGVHVWIDETQYTDVLCVRVCVIQQAE